MAETFQPVTQKVKEVIVSTKNLEKVFKITGSDNETKEVLTPALPPIESHSSESFVYDTSLQNTLEGMKRTIDFFRIREKPDMS